MKLTQTDLDNLNVLHQNAVQAALRFAHLGNHNQGYDDAYEEYQEAMKKHRSALLKLSEKVEP